MLRAPGGLSGLPPPAWFASGCFVTQPDRSKVRLKRITVIRELFYENLMGKPPSRQNQLVQVTLPAHWDQCDKGALKGALCPAQQSALYSSLIGTHSA